MPRRRWPSSSIRPESRPMIVTSCPRSRSVIAGQEAWSTLPVRPLPFAVRGEVAVQLDLRQSGQGAVGLDVVDELAHACLAAAVRKEALLEVEECVLAPARSAAEVEQLEPLVLSPARRLEEDEVGG